MAGAVDVPVGMVDPGVVVLIVAGSPAAGRMVILVSLRLRTGSRRVVREHSTGRVTGRHTTG
jgi:hypothetical protein